MNRQLLDVRGAAAHLATTERHIRRLVHEHRVPFYKVGGKVRLDAAELDRWLDEQRVEAS